MTLKLLSRDKSATCLQVCVQVLRDLRTKCHSLTYKVNQLESEERRLAQEITAMREKEESLRIEEVFLVNQVKLMPFVGRSFDWLSGHDRCLTSSYARGEKAKNEIMY